MKKMVVLLFTMLPAYAEIWEKPPYRPDEGHLPQSEQERQEVSKEFMDAKGKDEVKPHQDDRPRKSQNDRARSLRKPSESRE